MSRIQKPVVQHRMVPYVVLFWLKRFMQIKRHLSPPPPAPATLFLGLPASLPPL